MYVFVTENSGLNCKKDTFYIGLDFSVVILLLAWDTSLA